MKSNIYNTHTKDDKQINEKLNKIPNNANKSNKSAQKNAKSC